MVEQERFDDIVIGGGKGGKSLAMALGPAGHKVALIERGQIGGTCINVACIPTKTMVASVKLYAHAVKAHEFGVDIAQPGPSLKGIVERKRRVVKQMVDQHWNLFATTPNMDLIVGAARFVGPKVVEVTVENGSTRLLTAERIYINTGSRTAIPPIPGLSEVPYLTSTSVMELESIPQHLAIIGGGYIALEFAQIFARLGSEVTVLLRGSRFLPREDADISQAVKELLEADGVAFQSDVDISSIKQESDGSIVIDVRVDGTVRAVDCSHVLVAIGRTPNTEELNLNATGVDTDKRGNIIVNDHLVTSVPGIWALGDCNGGPLFTHVSWDDFRIVRDNVLKGMERSTVDRLIPYTLFIDPELGRVGLTEQEARAKGIDILVAKIPASKIPRATTSGETRGFLKAVVEKETGKILGCSFLCHSAGEIMSVLQMAMIGELSYTTVRDTIFTHPTMAESLNLLFAAV